MDFPTSITTGLTKYVVWQGRAARSEFWFFILFNVLADIAAAIVDAAAGTSLNGGFGPFYALSCLALFLPTLSVTIRRLHDTDRSGWWYWLFLVPLAGFIIMLIWLCQVGTAGENSFGGDPLDGLSETRSEFRKPRAGDLDRLERLAELHAKGILTDSEYQAQKAAALQ